MVKLKINLTPAIKNLDIAAHNVVSTKIMGGYRSVFRGRGLEFESYRAFTEGDDASRIDWKASLRTNQILLKEFVEERNLDVFFLVDVSASMVYSTTRQLKSEYAGSLAASLYYVVLNAGDSAGFALFNSKIVSKHPPAKGGDKFYIFAKNIVNYRYYGGAYNLEHALSFINTYLKRRSVVIIISDFIGMKGDWKKAFRLVAKKYEIVCIIIRDPADMKLPDFKGQVVLEDPFSGEQMLIRPGAIHHRYVQHVNAKDRELESVIISSGADYLKLITDSSFVKPIMSFFNARKQRLR
jgi:uncharacterized protein (DUF58 family)